MKIISKEYLGKEKVFDIGVASLKGNHNFILENNAIASNCFNKAHSVSYSILTYVSAYMKTHYPVEFFTALMSTRSKTLQPKSWALKAPEYIAEAKKFNVIVNPPYVNQSSFEFTISNNEIFFGLNAIRDVGVTAARMIIKARQKTPFKSVKDFVSRVNLQKVNTKTFEALVKAGAFDKLGYDRADLLFKCPDIYNYIKDMEAYKQRELDVIERNAYNARVIPLIERRNFLRKELKKIQNRIDKDKIKNDDMDNFHIISQELEPLEEQDLKKKVTLKSKEKSDFPELIKDNFVELGMKEILDQANYIGCYIGGHPMDLIKINSDKISFLNESEYANVAGVILSIKTIVTRKGKNMAFVEINDKTATAEIVIFPQLWTKISKLNLKETDIVCCKVKVERTEPDIKLILNSITLYEDNYEMDS
jgi:DNA polymerase III subunit alpha